MSELKPLTDLEIQIHRMLTEVREIRKRVNWLEAGLVSILPERPKRKAADDGCYEVDGVKRKCRGKRL